MLKLYSIKENIRNAFDDIKYKEILIGSSWAFSSRVLAVVLGVITNAVIAREYGAGSLGVVALLSSFLALGSIFGVLGTDTSILKLIPEYKASFTKLSAFKMYQKAHKLVIISSLITVLIFLMLSDLIALKLFKQPDLADYLSLASIFILVNSLVVFNSKAIRGLSLNKGFAVIQLLPSAFKLAFLAVMTALFVVDDAPVYALLFSVAITAVIGILIVNKSFKGLVVLPDKLIQTSYKNIIEISFPMFISSGVGFLITQASIILLGIYHSETEIGYYSVAVSIASLCLFVVTSINSVIAPKISEMYSMNENDEAINMAIKASKLSFWFTLPIVILIILLGENILSIIFGDDFAVAYWAMVLLALGQFVNVITGPTGIFLNMTGRQAILKNISIVTSVRLKVE